MMLSIGIASNLFDTKLTIITFGVKLFALVIFLSGSGNELPNAGGYELGIP